GVALLSLGGATVEGLHMTLPAMVIAGGLGVLGTAGALYAMNWAQRTVSPTKATLIYALEPVFAAFIGAAAGERLGLWSLGGGALVVLGAIVGELLPERREAVPA
ncbi:EamA family transporter, partial [bacterium]